MGLRSVLPGSGGEPAWLLGQGRGRPPVWGTLQCKGQKSNARFVGFLKPWLALSSRGRRLLPSWCAHLPARHGISAAPWVGRGVLCPEIMRSQCWLQPPEAKLSRMLMPRCERRGWGARVGLDPIQLLLPLPMAPGGLRLWAEMRCGCRSPKAALAPLSSPAPHGGGAGTGAVGLCTPSWEPPLFLPALARLSSAPRHGAFLNGC